MVAVAAGMGGAQEGVDAWAAAGILEKMSAAVTAAGLQWQRGLRR